MTQEEWDQKVEKVIRDNMTEFRRHLIKAMKWRGWDRNHRGVIECHAFLFIKWVDELFLKNGIEVEEYT